MDDKASVSLPLPYVSCLVLGCLERSDRVYALIAGAYAMLDTGPDGEPSNVALATLLQMAMDEVADLSHVLPVRDMLSMRSATPLEG